MTPLVSVCIPVYQGAEFLERTLDSVLAQTLTDLELVLADDASTDASARIAARYADRDPRVRVLRGDHNRGAVPNWNRVVAAAQGEFVKMMGQDDLLHATCLARQVQVLQDDASLGMVVAGRAVVDDRGRTLMRGRRPLGDQGVVRCAQALPRIVRSGTNTVGEPVTVLLRRSVLTTVGPFAPSLPYVVDLDYWCRVLEVAPIYVLPETLCSFRVSTRSWSVALAAGQADQLCSFLGGLQQRHPDLITTADVRRGCLRGRGVAAARRLLYLGLRARATRESPC